MMKWVCLIMLVIDILLFGAAGYRMLTVPDEKAPATPAPAVQATEPARHPPARTDAQPDEALAPVQATQEGGEVKFTIPVEGGESIELKSPPIETPDNSGADDPGAAVDKQQEALDDAKAKMRERFGSGN